MLEGFERLTELVELRFMEEAAVTLVAVIEPTLIPSPMICTFAPAMLGEPDTLMFPSSTTPALTEPGLATAVRLPGPPE